MRKPTGVGHSSVGRATISGLHTIDTEPTARPVPARHLNLDMLTRLGSMRARLTCLALSLAVAIPLAGCDDEDTGVCCTAVTDDGRLRVPVPDRTSSDPRDIIRAHPKFECSQLLCTSYRGSDPFCTRACSDGNACTEGFECATIITADPGPDSQIRPGDTFCVRKACTTIADCPDADDWECLDTYTNQPLGSTVTGTQAASMIGQCVKKEHKCGAQ